MGGWRRPYESGPSIKYLQLLLEHMLAFSPRGCRGIFMSYDVEFSSKRVQILRGWNVKPKINYAIEFLRIIPDLLQC